MSVAECCRKNYEEKLLLKIGVPKCCSENLRHTENYHQKHRCAEMLPEKLRRKTIVKNKHTEMLLKCLPYETFRQDYQ